MKKTAAIIFTLMASVFGVAANCETDAPRIETTGKILKIVKVKKNEFSGAANSFALKITASVRGASWETLGAEAAVVTVFIDGNYDHDVVLFAGRERFEYRTQLAVGDRNEHEIKLVLNEKRSAPKARNVKIHRAEIAPFTAAAHFTTPEKQHENVLVDKFAAANAPFIYLRPDTIDRFSDVPLLTFYEVFEESETDAKIRYTTVFTNEDGGTRSAALLARWGRLTDIEWIYEIRVRKSDAAILEEIYQGANHETKVFRGKRKNGRPLLLDATVNNNFSDTGCSMLLVSPMLVRADLAGGSRETVLDAFSWIYRIMAEEAVRENRIASDAGKLDENTVGDPRAYLYAEIYGEMTDAAVAFEIVGANGKTVSSDWENASLRVGRGGFVRIAAHFPDKQAPASFAVRCFAAKTGDGVCRNVILKKIVRLTSDYRSQTIEFRGDARDLKPNEAAVFKADSFKR